MGGSKDTKRADLLRTSFHQECEGNRLRCQVANFLGWCQKVLGRCQVVKLEKFTECPVGQIIRYKLNNKRKEFPGKLQAKKCCSCFSTYLEPWNLADSASSANLFPQHTLYWKTGCSHELSFFLFDSLKPKRKNSQ